MRELLCNVDHDRKFFVPATNHVLQETVRHTKDFSACDAMIGFEAVHQYANNLLTRPWRPEFKTIRVSVVTSFGKKAVSLIVLLPNLLRRHTPATTSKRWNAI